MKTALITGITGQDGSYLAEFLLEKGYDVHGTIRRSSVDYRERIAHLEGHPNFHLHYADLGDSMSILQVVRKIEPNEIYNLAAQSHVQVSFDAPEFTADVDATGVRVSLKLYANVVSLKPAVSIRLRPRNSTARWRRFLRMKTPRSILFALCRGETLRLLDRQGVPRSLRHVLLLGHPVQP